MLNNVGTSLFSTLFGEVSKGVASAASFIVDAIDGVPVPRLSEHDECAKPESAIPYMDETEWHYGYLALAGPASRMLKQRALSKPQQRCQALLIPGSQAFTRPWRYALIIAVALHFLCIALPRATKCQVSSTNLDHTYSVLYYCCDATPWEG